MASPFLPESELKAPILQPPGEGRKVGAPGKRSIYKVASDDAGGAYAILEIGRAHV